MITSAPALGLPATPPGPARFAWRRAVVYGLLWAVAIAVTETLVLPLDVMSSAEWLRFIRSLLAQWTVAGVALATTTMLLEHRLRPWMIAPALIAFSFLVSGGWWVTGSNQRPDSYFSTWSDGAGRVHVFWGAMVYGGLFVAAYRLSMHSERTRELLGRAEIARQQTENLFSEAQLLSLQGQVDPAFLLRVMTEVERRYAADAAGMGRLLDALVSFLRAAMPGVRSGASTLAAELLLAEQYAQVWAELEPGRATWIVRVDGAAPNLPFPPLLLLPVLDQLASGSGPGPGVELRLTQCDDHCTVSLTRGVAGHERGLTPPLLYRLQVGLRAVFGDAWHLQIDPASPTIVLSLPLAATGPAPPLAGAPLSSPTQPETIHG